MFCGWASPIVSAKSGLGERAAGAAGLKTGQPTQPSENESPSAAMTKGFFVHALRRDTAFTLHQHALFAGHCGTRHVPARRWSAISVKADA